MGELLKDGQSFQTEGARLPCRVKAFLGGGGQGEVYRAQMSGGDVALKWYFPRTATPAQRFALEALIRKGAPDQRFLWPIDLVSASGVQGFGYVMALRDPGYRSLFDLMKRRSNPTFSALATAGLQLADGFLKLHAQGWCYRDISFGNVFLEPGTGEILICDNDNVAVDGSAAALVEGTPRFMAPEIVRGEADPSTHTDLFSLAVLLFYMFMFHHPLEGKHELSIRCMDLPAMKKLYGTQAVFIFDPRDPSNKPVAGYHDNALAFWPLYPQFLRDLFVRSFTAGLRDARNGRVRESEWRAAMARLRDCIVYCPACGHQSFVDPGLGEDTARTGSCWSCGAPIPLPLRLILGHNLVVLNYDTSLYPHHLDIDRLYDFGQPMAAVAQHPSDPRVWGLKNLSAAKWVVTKPDGGTSDVAPGLSVSLSPGARISFGRVEGVVAA
jgi:serine/threonine protein kinase